MTPDFPNVPCNGCTLCCKGDAVRLLPGDSDDYLVEPHPFQPGQWMLAHKPNGDCVYLGDAGCTIHPRRPKMCREMDCRMVFRKVKESQAQRLNIPMDVWRRGKELCQIKA